MKETWLQRKTCKWKAFCQTISWQKSVQKIVIVEKNHNRYTLQVSTIQRKVVQTRSTRKGCETFGLFFATLTSSFLSFQEKKLFFTSGYKNKFFYVYENNFFINLIMVVCWVILWDNCIDLLTCLARQGRAVKQNGYLLGCMVAFTCSSCLLWVLSKTFHYQWYGLLHTFALEIHAFTFYIHVTIL